LITSSSRWERPGNRLSKSLLGGGLGADLHHEPMLDRFVSARRSAVSLDVFLAGKKHQTHSAEPDQFDVSPFGPRQRIAISASCLDTPAERIASRSARSQRLGAAVALRLSRCRIVDRENPPPSSVPRTSTAKAGAGRGMVCCAFPPIRYMKPDQPGASPMPGLAKVRAAQQRWR
jgi:hypothetical protein